MPWRQEWLELGKDVLIHFLKHALPGKLEGNIAFGTGNPEYTGYITGIAAVFIRSMENIFFISGF